MLDKVKNEIFVSLQALFAEAAVDEMAGDMEDYNEKLQKIVKVAEIMDVKTELFIFKIDLKKLNE